MYCTLTTVFLGRDIHRTAGTCHKKTRDSAPGDDTGLLRRSKDNGIRGSNTRAQMS